MKPTRGAKLELESTGEPTLDRILGGGIPAQSVVVLAGEPGSGKTVLTLQMLFHAARAGKKCLYFTTLSEPALKVIRYMQLFDFFDVRLLDDRVILADLGGAVRQGVEALSAELEAQVEKHEPAFVVIDSFRAVGEMLRGADRNRSFVYDLAVRMAGWGATTLLVGEYTRQDVSVLAEFAVADGIIRLGSERQDLTSIREMEVLKLRGADYVSGRHFFEITSAGVKFYPRVSAPTEAPEPAVSVSKPPASTGLEALDSLLGGGLPRGSATLINGPTGSGKTLLGLEFLVAGASAGEKGILFTLEETPEQLREIGAGLGWDLGALEARGDLLIKYASPVELSADRFLFEARKEVEHRGARRAVFDSLTTLALGVPSERRFKEMIYAIAKHLRSAGVTVVLTLETDQLLGASRLSGQGVSFVVDNLLQLRYVEVDGRLGRAVSVLKVRGAAHGTELRMLTIGRGGPRVGDAPRKPREVLTNRAAPALDEEPRG